MCFFFLHYPSHFDLLSVLITFQVNTSISGLVISFERRFSFEMDDGSKYTKMKKKNQHTHSHITTVLILSSLSIKENEVDWKVTI